MADRLEYFKHYVENSWFLYLTGVAVLAYALLKIVYNFYTYFVIYFTTAAVDYRQLGRWALVTGATDGIGKEWTRTFARMGISVVLVGRNPEKLHLVAKEIESEFHVETKSVVLDFTRHDDVTSKTMTSSIYDVISEAIRELDVGILVNNVGMSAGKLNEFLYAFDSFKYRKKMTEGNTNLVNCNVLSQVKVTQLVLPGMVTRGKGLIINMSSSGGRFVMPYGAMYSASKRFMDTFSKALSYEYENKGIVVQSLQPGFIYTNLSTGVFEFRRSFAAPDPKTFITHAVRSVGKDRVTSGFWVHAMQMYFLNWIPDVFTMIGMKLFMKFMSEDKMGNDQDCTLFLPSVLSRPWSAPRALGAGGRHKL